VHIHESQSKAWGSPGRELTKISKKNTLNRLILKGEMGNSLSFCLELAVRRLVSFRSD
jgi:hypothetical protein